MISVNDDKIQMVGTAPDLLQDMLHVLCTYYDMVEEEYNKEIADRLLVAIGRGVYVRPWTEGNDDDGELANEIADIFSDMVEFNMRKEME